MRLYKYRDMSDSAEDPLSRLSDILLKNAFWCASPSSLNDPQEFIWECDFEPTSNSVTLLTKLLIQFQKRSPYDAFLTAQTAVSFGKVDPIARPIFEALIKQTRAEIGVCCFATSSDNPVMWERYGGNGNGICIEIEVPNELLGEHLNVVDYVPVKKLHIDQLFTSMLIDKPTRTKEVYSVALLTKTLEWAAEKEIRFISFEQNISVQLSGSKITQLILGSNLSAENQQRISSLVESLPYQLPVSRNAKT